MLGYCPGTGRTGGKTIVADCLLVVEIVFVLSTLGTRH